MATLEKVTLPNTIQKIGSCAFQKCTSLKEINLPDGITEIEFFAFQNCKSLQDIKLPSELRKIGSNAFSGCSQIKEIKLPQNLIELDRSAFEDCSQIKEIVIPEGVITIQNNVFAKCTNLTNVIFRNNIVEIPENLFSGCKSLKSIVLPNSVNIVGISAFKDCVSLTDVILPNNAKYYTDEDAVELKKYNFYKGTFFGCNSLKNIKCHNGNTPDDFLKYIPENCPFAVNGGKSENPDFDSELLAGIANYGNSSLTIKKVSKSQQVLKSDVDMLIPVTKGENKKTFAIIIGNQEYKSVPNVSFAEHDAKTFADYCKKTLGMPQKNINLYCNASYGEMVKAVQYLRTVSAAFNGDINVLFYYSGHGVPNEKTHETFLLPVDADGSMTEVCYATNKLYKELSEIKSNHVIVFLDACFSGAQRDGGVLQASARGVAIKAKEFEPRGKMVVFGAASGDETAYPYEGKSHGMFTYFLLKCLKETKGDVTLGALADYVKSNVMQYSVTENKKIQTPTVTPSNGFSSDWQNIELK